MSLKKSSFSEPPDAMDAGDGFLEVPIPNHYVELIDATTGELIAGEMGSPQRTQYTVIGQAANLGARICNNAQGGQILISQATYDLVRDQVEAKPIQGMQFKGVGGAVTVYEVKRILP